MPGTPPLDGQGEHGARVNGPAHSRALARIAITGIYLLRGVSRNLQRAGRARAVREGTTLRRVLLQGLHEYAAGTWTPQPEGTLDAAPGLDPRGTPRPAGPGKFGHIHQYNFTAKAWEQLVADRSHEAPGRADTGRSGARAAFRAGG